MKGFKLSSLWEKIKPEEAPKGKFMGKIVMEFLDIDGVGQMRFTSDVEPERFKKLQKLNTTDQGNMTLIVQQLQMLGVQYVQYLGVDVKKRNWELMNAQGQKEASVVPGSEALN